MNFMLPDSRPDQDKGFLRMQERGGIIPAIVDAWLEKYLLSVIGNPPISIQVGQGKERYAVTPAPVANVRIKNHIALLTLIANPAYYFGELYSAGDIEVEGDLPTMLASVYRHLPRRSRPFPISLLSHLGTGNSQVAARRNIHHHYDIGNEFYEAWLDRAAMQYTCAYFPNPDMSLEDAQLAKMHHICRKLGLQPGQQVVEAGCGWGGLARFMAREYGVKVKAYNISHEQVRYAQQKARDENLSDRVEYIEDDFRNIQGSYDVFVSVGMLEHIGIENYAVLGQVINRSLRGNGKGLIHAIGRNRPDALNAWIVTRIFPGACPPSLSQVMNVFEPYSFSVLDVENLRLHYSITLKHWLARFEKNLPLFRTQHDESFLRCWRLYLAGSQAAFTAGTLQLFQVLFTRPHNNKLPWSRVHLYSSLPD